MSDLTVKELAERLNINPHHLRRLIKAGKVPGSYRLFGRWRLREEDLAALRGQAEKQAAAPPVEAP